MKELSIEQKAKRYDNAKYMMKEYLESGNAGVIAENTIKKAFPELSELDDERIRKALIEFLVRKRAISNDLEGVDIGKTLAWLEKQERKPAEMRETKPKDISEFLDRLTTIEQEFLWEHIAKIRELDKEEQKPADNIEKPWNEEDERIYQSIMDDTVQENQLGDKQISWLKSLKDRVQPKQEWSKEDENNILFLTSIIEECFKDKEKITLCSDVACANFTKEDVIDRLKSIRPQNTWNPSDEQLEALDSATKNCAYSEYQDCLRKLLKQLKRLKG